MGAVLAKKKRASMVNRAVLPKKRASVVNRAVLPKKRASVLKRAVLPKTGVNLVEHWACGQAWSASKRLRGRSGVVIRVLGQDSAQQALDRSVYDDSCSA